MELDNVNEYVKRELAKTHLTVTETARLLGVSKATVYRYAHDGVLTSQQLAPGKAIRFAVDKVNKLLVTA